MPILATADRSRFSLSPDLETHIARFEKAWQAGQPPPLADYLPTGDNRIKVLKELIKIDLEFRWRSAANRRLLEDYLVMYPEIQQFAQVPLDLIVEEYRVRQRWGDRPCHAEYSERFTEHDDTLLPALKRVDAELAVEFTKPKLPVEPANSHDQPTSPPENAAQNSTIDSDDTPAAKDEAGQAAGLPTIEGYDILDVLGRGGMGVVYKARHRKLKRLVALKMIVAGAHAGPDQLARFQAEAEAVAKLQHPNIVQIHEVGEQGGLPYFSLEYVDGGSLDKKLAGTPQNPQAAAQLVRTLAEAMHAAHRAGIIHRDLKPANVLLAKDGMPKITDFGLAKQLDSAVGQTRSGAIMGTPSYMAPEQAAGKIKEIGPTADVYALGAILYEMLTGRPPFKAATPLDTVMQVIAEEPVPAIQLQPKLSRDLNTICMKCLNKEPHNRYVSGEAFADDLQHFLEGEPIHARPVGTLERMGKWCSKNPLLATLTSSLAGVVIIAFAVVSWQLTATTAALTREEHQKRERVLAQVNALRNAAPGAVPSILKDLEANRDEVLPRLRERYAEEGEHARRMRLALALLPSEPESVRDELTSWLLRVDDPAEVRLVRDALKPHAGFLTKALWQQVDQATTPPAERFRALVALADFDPTSPRWQAVAPDVIDELLTANPLHLGIWVQALQPVRKALWAPLEDVFRGKHMPDQRHVAATVLADYAAENPHLLAELVMDADEKQFASVYLKLKHHGQHAVSLLQKEMDKQFPSETREFFRKAGQLTKDDAPLKISNGQSLIAKVYDVRLQAGKTYHISMTSKDLDSFLVLQNKLGYELASDNNGGGDLNSLLVYTAVQEDTYRIYTASKGTGSFVLIVGEAVGEEPKEKLARRQANAAVALLKMNQPKTVWPLLKHSSDPRLRSYLIHRLGSLGSDPRVIIKRLEGEPDVTIQRALILSLSEFDEKKWPDDDRNVAIKKIQEIYCTATDSGMHASAEWLLRHWKQNQWLKQVDEKWANEKGKREAFLVQVKKEIVSRAASTTLAGKPDSLAWWYVNGQGQTMVLVPGPVEFLMGSPSTVLGWREEMRHKKRISRSFAIGAKHVTKEQFLRFRPEFTHDQMRRYPNPTCPIGGVRWYEAAAYCNWLSEQEGIDPEHWCYEMDSKGRVVKLRENYLSLTGYRLPTEAEMEYATRAGTLTSRFYGESDELLGNYAWFMQNSAELTWPVGSKKPNDLGLFDVYGNLWNWCQDRIKAYPQSKADESVEDNEDILLININEGRAMRGRSFLYQPSWVRSANRFGLSPAFFGSDIGFRVARTLTAESLPAKKPPKPPGQSFHLPEHAGSVLAVAFSADGTRLVTGDKDVARVWDAQSGKVLFTLDAKGPFTRAQFGEGDRLLTLGSKENAVRLWDSQTGKALSALLEFKGVVRQAVFTPDGKRIVCADASGAFTILDPVTAKVVSATAAYDSKLVLNGLAVSPDGGKVCYALGKGSDWSLKVWDLEAVKEVQSWRASDQPVWAVAWSGDGKWIATGSVDQTVRVWHAATGKLYKTLSGPTKTVARVAFDCDGRRLAATSLDGIVRVWDVETGKAGPQFSLGAMGNGNVAFSLDGRRLAASAPGIVQIWDLPPP